MSEYRVRTRMAWAALVVALGISPGLTEATHLSWLGHRACAAERCEVPVPAGFTAQGEFELHTFSLPDEKGHQGRPEERVEALLTPEGREIARVTAAFRRLLD